MKLKDVRRPVPVSERVGVEFPRYFTSRLEAGKTPYEDVKWELRTASIKRWIHGITVSTAEAARQWGERAAMRRAPGPPVPIASRKG